MRTIGVACGLSLMALLLAACDRPAARVPVSRAQPSAPSPTPFAPSAGISDIMKYEIDPSADALWDAVGTYVDKHGTVTRQPRTDEEWLAAKGHAIVLAEAANLLLMEGRRVSVGDREVEDAGTPGNLNATQSQAAIDANRPAFVGFAKAMHEVADTLLKATEAKDANALMTGGAALDEVCEGCHLKFWYPGQRIPRLPDEAPEVGGSK